MSSETKTTLITFTIDGRSVTVPKGTTVYQAAKQFNIEIPIFCYQDRMPPFGACRVCLVEVEKMPKLQASCTLEATEGMVVKTQSELAIKGREGILEFLLINHPLDCPICDRGGECPLQEHALHHGPGKSRFFEEKRHFKKPLPLGPVLMLDRERCIICARCTRFGDLIAGDHALEFIDRGYKTEVGTPDGSPVKSKFIGNTIMICPVGALTSQVYRFRARPWDNDATNSSCTLCPVGCSMILDSRDGEIMRTRSQENLAVNDTWLCDKGWFGYEFVYHPERLKTPLLKKEGQFQKCTWDEALTLIADKIKSATPNGKIAAFGGNPLTTEENYLFQKLFREAAKVNHLDHRIGTAIYSLEEEGQPPGMVQSIQEMEKVKFALLLGTDLTEEFPVIWLRLRQAINRGAKVLFLGHYAPEIASYFTNAVLHKPGKEIENIRKYIGHLTDAFKDPFTILIGQQYLSMPNRAEILAELKNYPLNLLEGDGNSMGARIAGMRPDLGPLNEKLSHPGYSAIQVLETASSAGWDYLHVAGANPALKFPAQLWKAARQKLGFLVVQDLFLTETAAQADLVLPTLSFLEKGGLFMNIEGRLQSLLPGKELPEGLYSDGDIFKMIGEKLNLSFNVETIFNEKLKQTSRFLPFRSEIKNYKSFQAEGELLATFSTVLFDEGVRMQHNPHLKQLTKNPHLKMHPLDGVKKNLKENDPVKITANGNSLYSQVVFSEGVAQGTAVLPLGFKEFPVHDLAHNLLNGLAIKVEKVE